MVKNILKLAFILHINCLSDGSHNTDIFEMVLDKKCFKMIYNAVKRLVL